MAEKKKPPLVRTQLTVNPNDPKAAGMHMINAGLAPAMVAVSQRMTDEELLVFWTAALGAFAGCMGATLGGGAAIAVFDTVRKAVQQVAEERGEVANG
jgi:hypothetical protein